MNKSFFINRQSSIKFGIIVSFILLLYAPVLKNLVYDWIYLPDFSHGFLIPVISLYLVYERRNRLSNLSPSGQWAGFGLILFGIFLFFLGKLASEYFAMRFSLIVVIGGIILFLLGKDFYKTLLFPVVFLIFMIPLPSIFIDQITFPMQLLASSIAANLLYLIDIPVLKEGNIIHLTNTSLEVAEACSGIRSLFSLLALSVVFAYLTHKKFWKRVILISCAFPIAIAANATRVFGTGIFAYRYGDEIAQGFLHGFSGWIIFIGAFICLFFVGTILSKIKKNIR